MCSFNASVIILSYLAIFSRIQQLKVVVYSKQISYCYCVALDGLFGQLPGNEPDTSYAL